MVNMTVPSGLLELAALLRDKATLVLSGAGISTESGIPDYRGPNPDGSPRAVRSPMQYQEFMCSARARQRYWARSSVGWQHIAQARANAGHRAVAALEQRGIVQHIITQNVDGLHQAAGSQQVIELHGSLHRVRCLACGKIESRADVQHRLLCLNPTMYSQQGVTSDRNIAPDGDAEIEESLEHHFLVADCLQCQGILKPDVVFFGENVPPERTAQAWDCYQQAEVLLVIGSSLTVYSGYRFVRRAAQEGKAIAIINDGETRGDAEATIKIAGRLGELLPALLEVMA